MTPPNDLTLPKRYLTREEAAHVYNSTTDYLKRQPAHALPCNRRGRRTVLYDVRDLEAHFGALRESDGAPEPTGVAAMLYVPKVAA